MLAGDHRTSIQKSQPSINIATSRRVVNVAGIARGRASPTEPLEVANLLAFAFHREFDSLCGL